MALDAITRLRQMVGERIPPGGDETATRFTNAEIQDFLDRTGNDQIRAAYEGWKVKAGLFANLASTTEGNASRLNSDLFEHAKDMMRYYESLNPSTVQGRTRIGKIVRPGTGAV